MDYFYCPRENISPTSFFIEGDEYSHLVHVMRKKTGDLIRLVDGVGNAYDARIENLKGKSVHGAILQKLEHHNEPSVRVTLAAGMLKNFSKFDFLVEKVTELGVHEIIPLRTERTIPAHSRNDRWQKLALAAMKQSGRSFLPRVTDVLTLEQLLVAEQKYDNKFVAHEIRMPDSAITPVSGGRNTSILLVVGPEGGLSDAEIDTCLNNGFTPLYLGERRLRTETACIVAVALALMQPMQSDAIRGN